MIYAIWIVISIVYSFVLLRYKESLAWVSGAIGAFLMLLSAGEGILLGEGTIFKYDAFLKIPLGEGILWKVGLFLFSPMIIAVLLDDILTFIILPIYHFFRFIFKIFRSIFK